MKPLFGFFCERGPYRLITPNTQHARVQKLPSNQLRRSEPSKCRPCINTKKRTQGFQVKKKLFIKQVICQFRKLMTRMNKSYACISINYWLQQKCYQPTSTASSEHRRMMACGPESPKKLAHVPCAGEVDLVLQKVICRVEQNSAVHSYSTERDSVCSFGAVNLTCKCRSNNKRESDACIAVHLHFQIFKQ